ncbi:unnamed protein product, partial [Dibothriocephalus latus]
MAREFIITCPLRAILALGPYPAFQEASFACVQGSVIAQLQINVTFSSGVVDGNNTSADAFMQQLWAGIQANFLQGTSPKLSTIMTTFGVTDEMVSMNDEASATWQPSATTGTPALPECSDTTPADTAAIDEMSTTMTDAMTTELQQPSTATAVPTAAVSTAAPSSYASITEEITAMTEEASTTWQPSATSGTPALPESSDTTPVDTAAIDEMSTSMTDAMTTELQQP